MGWRKNVLGIVLSMGIMTNMIYSVGSVKEGAGIGKMDYTGLLIRQKKKIKKMISGQCILQMVQCLKYEFQVPHG